MHVVNPDTAPGAGPSECAGAYERGSEHARRFDVAFVEFTERGNLFRRDCMDSVLATIKDKSRDKDTAVIVYVHGWRHNADPADSNVQDFVSFLTKLAGNSVEGSAPSGAGPGTTWATGGPLSAKHVIGVYVGWRGIPFHGSHAEIATYWDRKPVAEEVGRGGVTELLLRLEHILGQTENEGGESGRDAVAWSRSAEASNQDPADYRPMPAVGTDRKPGKNVFVVLGHSFGGAIVLSALHDVLLERVITADPDSRRDACPQDRPCKITKPFGHAVVLINPAIEADQILQLKQAIGSTTFSRHQSILLQVLSTSADQATHKAFPLGQALGLMTWKQTSIWHRTNEQKWIRLREADLDRSTIGNFAPFRTGRLRTIRNSPASGPVWCYDNCVPGPDFPYSIHGCVSPEEAGGHFPPAYDDPISMVYADESFIASHNDVFTPRLRAYTAAIVTRALRRREPSIGRYEECAGDFAHCYEYFLDLEEEALQEEGKGGVGLGRFGSRDECAAPSALRR